MRKLILSITVIASILVSCDKDDINTDIVLGDYPVKEYYLERDPKVNVWGAGMDFVHSESKLEESELDYTYLTETDDFSYDIKFYSVKAYYYYADNGDLQVEGIPSMLLFTNTKACKLGEGVAFFDSLTTITQEMVAQLMSEPEIDFSSFKNEESGFYEREPLKEALDACVIGDDFRGQELVIPEGETEEEVQAVYLVETGEGAYVKFMVKQFKPEKPNDKQTLVRWQVISE